MSDIENGRRVYEALLEGAQKLFEQGVMNPAAIMNPESRKDLVAYLMPMSTGRSDPELPHTEAPMAVWTVAGRVQVEPNSFCELGKVYMVDSREADKIAKWARETVAYLMPQRPAQPGHERGRARGPRGCEAREAARDADE